MRIVVKIGSSSLVGPRGTLDHDLINDISQQISQLVREDHQVILVCSGAIATGLGILGQRTRPTKLRALQAASAVGQGALFSKLAAAMMQHEQRCAQVLLTMHDAAHRASWRNARGTLEQLLRWGIVPIVNENDTTATDEITFGDNDSLAAQVAGSLRADLLLLLTDIDGLYTENPSNSAARLIELVEDQSLLDEVDLASEGSHWGSGGMRSKVIAAAMASTSGCGTRIARASSPNVILRAAANEPMGTYFVPKERRESAFQLWLRHAKKVRGRLHIDAGALDAICARGASLLPVGIDRASGAFEPGDAIEIICDDQAVARGICQYGSEELQALITDSSEARGKSEAVHRDEMVLINNGL